MKTQSARYNHKKLKNLTRIDQDHLKQILHATRKMSIEQTKKFNEFTFTREHVFTDVAKFIFFRENILLDMALNVCPV